MTTTPSGWHGGSSKTIKYLTDSELVKFFEAVEANPNPVIRARDSALFHLLLAYGLRCLEAKLLSVRDLNFKTNPPQIYVTRCKEKHWKKDPKTDRKVYIKKDRAGDWYDLSDANVARLVEWLEARESMPNTDYSGPLFCTRQGGTISTNQINYITHQYAKAAGLEPAGRKLRKGQYIYPHQFRHSCAIRLARKGLSAFDIMKWLGHVSVISTQVYCDMVGPERDALQRRALRAIEGTAHD